MPWFGKKEPDDPNLLVAREELESVLPPGWEIHDTDRERFTVPGGFFYIWAAWASSEAEGRSVIAFGRDEADALRQVTARFRGEIEPRVAWRPPADWLDPKDRKEREFFGGDSAEGDELIALRELEAAVPPGWELFDSDRERFWTLGQKFETYACTARGPGDQFVLALGIGKAGSYRALKDALQGTLEEAPYWAPDWTPAAGITN